MPWKKRMHQAEAGNNHYVSVTGSSTNAGTIDSPWSLNHAFGGAKKGIQPGDTVWVSGGTYRSETGFNITVSGNATDKVTFKAYPGETVILDVRSLNLLPSATPPGYWMAHECWATMCTVLSNVIRLPSLMAGSSKLAATCIPWLRIKFIPIS
jgi:hypothetical protein